MIRPVLLLGDDRLYDASRMITEDEVGGLRSVVRDLNDTLTAFRSKYGMGRGIAAPQIGCFLRLIYLEWPRPQALLNPRLDELSPETFSLWDDCMSFPDLLVRVSRHRSCRLRFRDMEWCEHTVRIEDDFAELVQHEVDHLDGILATDRAISPRSLALRRQVLRARPLAGM